MTNYVLLETLNRIHERQRRDIAVDLQRRPSDSVGFELVHSAQRDFHRAVELFETNESLAFGDNIITAYVDREDTEYLNSNDNDFDVVGGIIGLTTTENPFE